jgi:hypothetical protein
MEPSLNPQDAADTSWSAKNDKATGALALENNILSLDTDSRSFLASTLEREFEQRSFTDDS